MIRLPSLPADAGAGLGLFDQVPDGAQAAAWSRALKTRALECYGTAGPAFVAWLCENRERVRETAPAAIAALAGTWVTTRGLKDGQWHRVARWLALIAISGELFREALRLPWGEGEALQAAERAFCEIVSPRGKDRAEVEAAVAALQQAITRRGSAFRHQNEDASRPLPDQLRIRWEQGGQLVWGFFPSAFPEIVGSGADARTAVKELMARGWLLPGTSGRLEYEKKVNGRKQRFYAFVDLEQEESHG